jgi:hypothetical protein
MDESLIPCFHVTIFLIAVGIFTILITAYFIEQFQYDRDISEGRPAPGRILYNQTLSGP